MSDDCSCACDERVSAFEHERMDAKSENKKAAGACS